MRCLTLVAIALVFAGAGLVAESVQITLPASVSFAVNDVGISTTGSPDPTTVSFTSLSVTSGHALRISVQADADFTPPSGRAIPASNISWTTSAPFHGVGSNGTLSTSAYGQLFQSTVGETTGSIQVAWTLAAPGTPLRSGSHVLTLRWKLESILP